MSLWSSREAEIATFGKASGDFWVDGISIDTRTLKQGDLFVALKGETRDGHDYVEEAFKAKAGAAMVCRPRPVQGAALGPLLTVANTQRALEDLARAARARSNAKIIAVTGSAGKTTTKEILRLACNALGASHASAASYNNHWGVPLSLACMPHDVQFGIFEIGMNHFGEIRNLVCFVRPHLAMITTIAPAHLEFFGNCESIADAKSEIFEGLLPGGAAVIPADSLYHERLVGRARQAGCAQIISFGQNGDAKLLSFAPQDHGMRVKADIMGQAVDCLVGAKGAHIAQNITAALAAVAFLDGDVLNAAAALKEFRPLKGRGARFESDGIAVIDESYNANPASMSAALGLLGQESSSRRIAVLGDMLEMGETGPAHHAALAIDIARNRVDLVFACGVQMRSLWDALSPSKQGAYGQSAAELVGAIIAAVRPGDTVLVKGSNGSRMSVIVEALRAKAR